MSAFSIPKINRNPELLKLLSEAKEKFDNMSREEKDELIQQQKESYVRGEMGMSEIDRMLTQYSTAAMELINDPEGTIERTSRSLPSLDRRNNTSVTKIKVRKDKGRT